MYIFLDFTLLMVQTGKITALYCRFSADDMRGEFLINSGVSCNDCNNSFYRLPSVKRETISPTFRVDIDKLSPYCFEIVARQAAPQSVMSCCFTQ